VSITEDATMSRTRSDGGATIVRVDAITNAPAICLCRSYYSEPTFPVRPWLSLVLVDTPVNKERETFLNVMEKAVMYRVFHLLPKTTRTPRKLHSQLFSSSIWSRNLAAETNPRGSC